MSPLCYFSRRWLGGRGLLAVKFSQGAVRNGGSLTGRKGDRCVHVSSSLLWVFCYSLAWSRKWRYNSSSTLIFFAKIGFLQQLIYTSLTPIFTQRDRWLKLTLAKLKKKRSLEFKKCTWVSEGFKPLRTSWEICSEYCLIPLSYPFMCRMLCADQAGDSAAKLFRWVFAF